MDPHYAMGEGSAKGTDANGGRNGRQHLQHHQIRLPNNFPPQPQQTPLHQLHQHQLNEASYHPRGECRVGGAEAIGRNNIGGQHLQHQVPPQFPHHGEATSVQSWGGNPIPAAMRPGDHVVGGNGRPTTIQDFVHRCEIQAQRAANLASQFQASWNSTGSRNDQHQQRQDYKLQSERALQTAAHFNAISNLARTWASEVTTSQKNHLDLLRRIAVVEAGTNPQHHYMMGAHATTDQDRRYYLPNMGARVASGELSQGGAAAHNHHQQQPSQAQHPNMGVAASNTFELDGMDLEPISIQSLRQDRRPLHTSLASAAPVIHAAPSPQQQGVAHSPSDAVNSLVVRSRLGIGNHQEAPDGCIQSLAGEGTRNSQVARAGSMQSMHSNLSAPTSRSAGNSFSAYGKSDQKSVAATPSSESQESQCVRLDQISPGPVEKIQLASAASHIYAAPSPQQQGVAHNPNDTENSLAVRSRLENHREAPDGCIQSLAGEGTRNSQVARAGSMQSMLSDLSAPTSRSAGNSFSSHGKSDQKSVAATPSSESQCVRLDQILPGPVEKMPTETNALQGHGRKPAVPPQADGDSEGAMSGRKLKEGQPSNGKVEVDVCGRVRLGPVIPEAKRPAHFIPTQYGCNPQQSATPRKSTSKPSQQLQSSTERTTIAGLKPAGEFGPKLQKSDSDASVDVNRFKPKKSDDKDDVRDTLNGMTALPQVSKRKKSGKKIQLVTVRRSTRKRVTRDNESNKCGVVSNSNTTTVVPRQVISKKKPNAKRKQEDISNEAGVSAADRAGQALPQADKVKRDPAMDALSRVSFDDAVAKRTVEESNADEVEFPPSKLCKVVETCAIQSSYIYAPMGHLWLDQELTGSSEMNVDTFCPVGTMVGRRWVWDEGYFVDEQCNPHSREYSTLGNAGVGASTHSSADPVPPSRARRVGRNRIKSSIIEQLAAGGLDPHTQITCEDYEHGPSSRFRKDLEADTVQPFAVRVSPDVPFIVDLHAHLCTSEIIGLLGGVYSKEEKCLFIQSAFPCPAYDSGNTDVEMDPVGQTRATEAISNLGLSVVGWYHSHPTFQPEPSITDIDNQAIYQQLFQSEVGNEGGSVCPFVGLIAGTYDGKNPTSETVMRWFHVRPRGKAVNFPMKLSTIARHQRLLRFDDVNIDRNIRRSMTRNGVAIRRALDRGLECIASPNSVGTHMNSASSEKSELTNTSQRQLHENPLVLSETSFESTLKSCRSVPAAQPMHFTEQEHSILNSDESMSDDVLAGIIWFAVEREQNLTSQSKTLAAPRLSLSSRSILELLIRRSLSNVDTSETCRFHRKLQCLTGSDSSSEFTPLKLDGSDCMLIHSVDVLLSHYAVRSNRISPYASWPGAGDKGQVSPEPSPTESIEYYLRQVLQMKPVLLDGAIKYQGGIKMRRGHKIASCILNWARQMHLNQNLDVQFESGLNFDHEQKQNISRRPYVYLVAEIMRLMAFRWKETAKSGKVSDSPIRQSPRSVPTKKARKRNPPSSGSKRRRCGICDGCMREDCGACLHCLDKSKFGGKDRLRQKCIHRKCENFSKVH